MDSSSNNKNPPRKDPPTRHRPDTDEDNTESSSSSRSSTKSQSSPSADDKSAKEQARAAALRASSSGVFRKPRAALDALAKSRGRKPSSNVRHQPKRAIPSHLKSSSSSNTTKLQRLQEEVAAKERNKTKASVRRPPPMGMQSQSNSNSTSSSSLGSSLSAVKQLNRMEADIASKERARVGRGSGAKRTGTQKQASTTNRLDRMEAEIAAKAKVGRASSALKKSNGNSNNSNRTSNRNDALAKKLQKAKAASNTPATTPGAVSSKGNAKDVSVEEGKKQKDTATEGIVTYAGAMNGNKKTAASVSKNYHRSNSGDNDPVDIMVPNGSNDEEFTDENAEGRKNNLAVAVAVEEDNNAFIPSAVEYDPDAKLPVYKNHRFRVYSLLSCTILIIMVACSIAVFAVLEKDRSSANMVPTEAPTCLRCTSEFIEYIELEVGIQKLSDPTSPEYMAKEWIIHEDEMQLMPTDKSFVQRYLLAAFYFDTHQVADWRSCNQQSPDPATDETDECDLMKVTNIKPLTFTPFAAIRWLSAVSECQWAGVVCDHLGNVRRINLHGQEISGTLPTSVARLPYIQTLSLHMNNFTGTLPGEYSKLKHVVHIELHENRLTGTFPGSWANIRNLQQLNLAQNLLTGQLPTKIGNFRTIKGIYLFDNQISGTLPSELANANTLAYFRIQKNALTGTIPSELGDMPLTELWLQRNFGLTGTLPLGLSKLSNSLTDIRLGMTAIGGTLPEFLFEMSQVWRMDFSDARFTGTLSTNFGKLGSLQSLRLTGNQLSGTIPTEMGLMTSLYELSLFGNNISGTIPPAVCALRLEQRLEFLSMNCLPESDSAPSVVCDCCSICCNSSGSQCVFP